MILSNSMVLRNYIKLSQLLGTYIQKAPKKNNKSFYDHRLRLSVWLFEPTKLDQGKHFQLIIINSYSFFTASIPSWSLFIMTFNYNPFFPNFYPPVCPFFPHSYYQCHHLLLPMFWLMSCSIFANNSTHPSQHSHLYISCWHVYLLIYNNEHVKQYQPSSNSSLWIMTLSWESSTKYLIKFTFY